MVKVLILGTGSMAVNHAKAFAAAPNSSVVGAVETDPTRRAEFAKQFGLKEVFADLDSALAWGKFDAVANVTPDQVHYSTTMKLIAAGKNVFCEKPLATNYPDAVEMADAAEAKGIINMVNLTQRNSPVLKRAHDIVAAGELGEIRHFQAHYLQSWLVSKAWGDWSSEYRWLWRISGKHGSKGVIGDIGIHIMDLASYVANSDIVDIESRMKTFHKAPGDRIGEYVLDVNDSAIMTAELANGAIGTITASRFATGFLNETALYISGTKGALELKNTGPTFSLRTCIGPDMDTITWTAVETPPVPSLYEQFVVACNTGKNGDPSFRRAANIQRLIDLCFEQDAARAK